MAKIEARIRSVHDYELALVARVLKVEPGSLMTAGKSLDADVPDLLGRARQSGEGPKAWMLRKPRR